nr:MAG TPA: type I neck protein [Caudoviricetes sp.]
MPLTKLEFHYEGFDAIRKSDGVKAKLREWGEQMVSQAGPEDFEYSEYEGTHRARVTVRPKTRKGAKMEASDKVLTTAFGSLS